MLRGPAEENSARPLLPLNVPPAFAKLWEVTVCSAVSGRPNVREDQNYVLDRRIVVKIYGAGLR